MTRGWSTSAPTPDRTINERCCPQSFPRLCPVCSGAAYFFRGVTGPKTLQAKQCSPHRLQQKEKHRTSCEVQCFLVENSGIEPLTSCMPCKRSPERYRNTPPTRKCGDRLNIALIRSIHQKGLQLHPASRNHAPPTRQFYHPIFKCVNGFCSERRSFTRKVFSDSLLSAILILHIKVALFIFPQSIDKEVFSTMPMYYRCFLSMNQPHDP